MGYQEYLVTAKNEKDFQELLRSCNEARDSGFYNDPAPRLEPRSVAVFKQNIGLFPEGTHALWAAGDRMHGNEMGALLPPDATCPRAIFTAADNSDALGMGGEYTKGIDFDADQSENEYLTRYSPKRYCELFAPGLEQKPPDPVFEEFMRRLNKEGYRFELDDAGAGAVYGGRQQIRIMSEGEIQYKPEYRNLAFRVRDIRDEVSEYMRAFQNAAPSEERFSGGGKGDTRTLLLYNNAELAARRLSRGGMDFVTWRTANGHREIGHYFDSYAAAKEDFAIRCGLIDSRKLFSETELLMIRSGLAQIGDITPDMGADEMRQIRSLVEKINDLTIPHLHEEEQESEDLGREPGIDL